MKFRENINKKIGRITKKEFVFFRVVLFCCLVMFPAADCVAETVSSSATMDLQLESVISVEAETSTVSENFTGTGSIEFTANFIVTANTNQVDMFVETTAFYLDGNTSDPEVTPIPLEESEGVEIDPDEATLTQGSNPASYSGDGDPVESYPSRKSVTLSFESSDSFTFNHSTAVTVTWDQTDPLQPAGQYFAKIKLTCITAP